MNPAAAPTERPSQILRAGVTPPSRRGGSGRSLDDVERMPRRKIKAKADDGCAVCHL